MRKTWPKIRHPSTFLLGLPCVSAHLSSILAHTPSKKKAIIPMSWCWKTGTYFVLWFSMRFGQGKCGPGRSCQPRENRTALCIVWSSRPISQPRGMKRGRIFSYSPCPHPLLITSAMDGELLGAKGLAGAAIWIHVGWFQWLCIGSMVLHHLISFWTLLSLLGL